MPPTACDTGAWAGPVPVTGPAPDPGGCHAIAGCAARGCFQVRVEAFLGRRLIRHCANACAAHIGELVQGVRIWARDGNLTDGSLTVLVIDAAAESRRAAGAEPGPLGHGFAFAALPIPRPTPR